MRRAAYDSRPLSNLSPFKAAWANIRCLHDRPRPQDGLAGFLPFWLTLPYLLFLTPAFIWAFLTMLRRTRDERFRYLLWTPAFPLLVAPAGMARGHGWGPVYLGLADVVALWTLPIAIMAACNALVLARVVALTPVALPRFPPLSLLPYLYGWDAVAKRVEHEIAQVDKGTVVVTDDYEIAAALSYYGALKFPVLLADARIRRRSGRGSKMPEGQTA